MPEDNIQRATEFYGARERADAVAAKGKKAKAKALSAKVASASAPLEEKPDRW